MTSTERGSYNERGSYKCDGIPMDPLITTAARALAAGDPLGALKRVALRDDAPALALRGIAMAQLGDLVRRSEEHTSELQSLAYLVCRLLLEKKKQDTRINSNNERHPVSKRNRRQLRHRTVCIPDR